MTIYDNDYDYRFKIIIIGDENIGKTSMVRKLTDDEFSKSYVSTIGVDFSIYMAFDGMHTTKLQIWDTAGQEKFRIITKSYYRCCQGAIIMFDLNNRESFDNLEYWMNQININTTEKPHILLIGNKSDLESKVKQKEINDFCKKYNLKYHQTSIYKMNMTELEEIFKDFAIDLKEKTTLNNEEQLKIVPVKSNKNCCFF